MIREIKVRCAACGHLTRIPTVTNADKIRAMTDEELDDFLNEKMFGKVVWGWKNWLDLLKQEIEE